MGLGAGSDMTGQAAGLLRPIVEYLLRIAVPQARASVLPRKRRFSRSRVPCPGTHASRTRSTPAGARKPEDYNIPGAVRPKPSVTSVFAATARILADCTQRDASRNENPGYGRPAKHNVGANEKDGNPTEIPNRGAGPARRRVRHHRPGVAEAPLAVLET